MKDLLQAAIDDAVDSSTPLPDLLRKLLVIGRRTGSSELTHWASQELGGYEGSPDEKLPDYRRVEVAVSLIFSGVMNSRESMRVQRSDIPNEDGLHEHLFVERLTQPVSELAYWVQRGEGVGLDLSVAMVQHLRTWSNDQRAPAITGMVLNGGRRQLSLASIDSVLDRVRNGALELCLDIERVLPLETPTGAAADDDRSERALNIQIDQFVIQNMGTGSVGSVSNSGDVSVEVSPGDLDGLMNVARQLGLSEAAQGDLKEAVHQDESSDGQRTQSFLSRLRNGAYDVAGQVSTRVATDQITQAINGYFG